MDTRSGDTQVRVVRGRRPGVRAAGGGAVRPRLSDAGPAAGERAQLARLHEQYLAELDAALAAGDEDLAVALCDGYTYHVLAVVAGAVDPPRAVSG